MKFNLNRENEFAELTTFAKTKESGFLYVRGRRRVGKSWLLSEWGDQQKNVLFFSGKKDASKAETLQQFVQAWALLSKSNILTEIRSELLSWDRIFSEILIHQKSKNKKIILIFDEIQWITKDRSGFVGAIKAAWVRFEKTGLVSVIICGSSSKFFSDHVGGEEKILRGIATRAPLWVHPIAFAEFYKMFKNKWNIFEVTLLYMMIGGIPYYLQQIDLQFGFVHAVNAALFAKESIFLSEADELLSLEFNKAGLRRVKEILSVLSIYGSSQASIREKLKIQTATVSETFEKLTNYDILEKNNFENETKKTIKSGVEEKYYLKDFFLNFYFSSYKKYEPVIQRNSQGKKMVFSDLLNEEGYYIQDFTGKAFENLIRYQLEGPFQNQKLLNRLKLSDPDFFVGTYQSKAAQIDLVVTHRKDRLVRLIECKWGKESSTEIAELCNKEFPLKPTQQRLNIIIKSQEATKAYRRKCIENNVILITLKEIL